MMLFEDTPPVAETAPTRARRSPVRASAPPRRPIAPPAPHAALEGLAAAALDGLDAAPEEPSWSPEERARIDAALGAPTVPGVAHATWLRAQASALLERRARGEIATATSTSPASPAPTTSTTSTPGGISSCEPPVVDPADLLLCECGLTVHRASMPGHLAVASDFSRWSSHRERMAARMMAADAEASP